MTDNQTRTELRGETAAGQSTESDVQTCPECAGKIVTDSETAESLCAECGLVIHDQQIDTGPEWRAFDAAERETKSRVGAPTTPLLHDRGLSTTIGWRNTDVHGNQVSAPKRKKLSRLRTWNERFRTRDSSERNLKQALGEINRMASALGVPDPTRETASVIYRRALDDDLLPGRSIEGVATASLYAASRLEGIPRSIDEVAAVSRIGATETKRTYRYIARELDLAIPPTNPIEYLGRFASKLECSDETEHLARKLVKTAISAGVHSGRDPVSIAASALYAAGQLTNQQLTQKTVSEVSNVSEVTIRNRYPEVLAATEEAE
ncbi:MAG: TFIIB-type zinc ribbon-containing protein [Halolamina sp.]|uniref:transcription initiation factor IIB n=1 Tax=Halolamina sp. TaxID=1940283 RepID=UPI002FC31F9F